MRIYKRRDLTIVELDRYSLVIACDSCGGVGEKEADALPCPPFYVGAYTSRVALMEVLCSGARIVSVADNVCNEMDSTGSEIMRGIRRELAKIGLDDSLLTGSTEENFTTRMTGLGVTVVGVATEGGLRFAPEGAEGYVILVGLPKMGGDVLLADDDPDIFSYKDIQRLTRDRDVLEIVPVGSKGVACECRQLAKLLNRTFTHIECGVDIHKSAGPATCAIALTNEKRAYDEASNYGLKVIGMINSI